jgi:hypothetical protein
MPTVATKPSVGERVELGRYNITAGTRILYGQRVNGIVRVTDRPASGGRRSFSSSAASPATVSSRRSSPTTSARASAATSRQRSCASAMSWAAPAPDIADGLVEPNPRSRSPHVMRRLPDRMESGTLDLAALRCWRQAKALAPRRQRSRQLAEISAREVIDRASFLSDQDHEWSLAQESARHDLRIRSPGRRGNVRVQIP